LSGLEFGRRQPSIGTIYGFRDRENKIYHDSMYSYDMSDSEISLSIITLSYNQAEFIQDNIDSIKNALISRDLRGRVEHIFVDPGSNDNSREIIDIYSRRYPNVIKIFERDSGPAEGLNKGLGKARGEWIGILNADDYYDDQSILQFLEYIPKLSRYEIVYGYGYLFKDS
jgi:glycosyltransferase involved in cell wall biosynthesis